MSAAPMIELSGLQKHYGDLHVLDGIDLTVARGEVVCIIGPSGSGKSTLLRCINNLEENRERPYRDRRQGSLPRRDRRRRLPRP